MAARRTVLLISIATLALTAGCSRVPGHQGFIIDPQLAATVKPGVDNKASVQGTLGRPSFTGQFDENDWYYVSRDTKQLAYKVPRPSGQTILHVRFDGSGNVATVERTGLEKVAMIRPNRDITPTLGRNRSFFQELFGNIGQVGSVGRGGGSTDNPDGN
jgi:outer membrane protein assembly factor BamE (lipoprotein component of BamABCDE complex)